MLANLTLEDLNPCCQVTNPNTFTGISHVLFIYVFFVLFKNLAYKKTMLLMLPILLFDCLTKTRTLVWVQGKVSRQTKHFHWWMSDKTVTIRRLITVALVWITSDFRVTKFSSDHPLTLPCFLPLSLRESVRPFCLTWIFVIGSLETVALRHSLIVWIMRQCTNFLRSSLSNDP